jgi:hypothetical protein
MMKRYQVFIRCRELPAAHAEYTYNLNASAFHVAVHYALREFRREPHVRRKKLMCVEIRATITAVVQKHHHEEIILPLDPSGGD